MNCKHVKEISEENVRVPEKTGNSFRNLTSEYSSIVGYSAYRLMKRI